MHRYNHKEEKDETRKKVFGEPQISRFSKVI